MPHLLLSFFTFATLLQAALAQSDASCLPYYNWTFNTREKSPCEVASLLLAVCIKDPFPVPALPDGNHYLGPTLQSANPCQCNTVVYSLMSACAACQGRTYLSWSVWSANCVTVSIGSYPEPIPAGVAVPGWAYFDVKTNDNFDQSNARTHANATESTAIPTPTPTQARPSSSVHSGRRTASSSISLTSSSAQPSASADAAIGGGETSGMSAHANKVGGSIVGSPANCASG